MWRPKANTAQRAENVGQFYVANGIGGQMLPLSAVTSVEQNITGPEFTMRYNEYRRRADQRGGRAGL